MCWITKHPILFLTIACYSKTLYLFQDSLINGRFAPTTRQAPPSHASKPQQKGEQTLYLYIQTTGYFLFLLFYSFIY